MDAEDYLSAIREVDIKTYLAGEDILREGEIIPLFFVILDGQVSILLRDRKIRVLAPQDVFGLESYSLKRPSPYTARALQESRVASYGREALDHFMRETPRMAQTILASTLRQLDQTSRNMVSDHEPFPLENGQMLFFSAGDVIIREESMENVCYRLVSSQEGLRVSTGGKTSAIIANPGEFVGEIAAFLGLPQEATVTSIGESVLEGYRGEDLPLAVRDCPDVAARMLQALRARWMQSRSAKTFPPV